MYPTKYGATGSHYELVITQAFGTIKSFAAEADTEEAALNEISKFVESGSQTLDDDQSWRVDYVREVNGNQSRRTVCELKH